LIKNNCTKCNGTGWIIKIQNDVDVAIPCECRNEENEIIKGEHANIPKRFLASKLEYAFTPDKRNHSQIMAKKIVQKFVNDYPAIEKGLLLQGSVGLGKTSLLCGIGTELIKKNFSIYYIDWNDLTRIMGSGEDAGSRNYGKITQLMNKLATIELLLFDELGASKISPWVYDNIYYLINRRYNNKLITIFATNFFDSVSDNRDSLTDRVGDRIRSRLYEMTDIIKLDGTDYRHKV